MAVKLWRPVVFRGLQVFLLFLPIHRMACGMEKEAPITAKNRTKVDVFPKEIEHLPPKERSPGPTQLNVPGHSDSRPRETSPSGSESGALVETDISTGSGDSTSPSCVLPPSCAFSASGNSSSAVDGFSKQNQTSGDDSPGNDRCEMSSTKTGDCPKTTSECLDWFQNISNFQAESEGNGDSTKTRRKLLNGTATLLQEFSHSENLALWFSLADFPTLKALFGDWETTLVGAFAFEQALARCHHGGFSDKKNNKPRPAIQNQVKAL